VRSAVKRKGGGNSLEGENGKERKKESSNLSGILVSALPKRTLPRESSARKRKRNTAGCLPIRGRTLVTHAGSLPRKGGWPWPETARFGEGLWHGIRQEKGGEMGRGPNRKSSARSEGKFSPSRGEKRAGPGGEE